MYYTGDTVRLAVAFADFDKLAIDPEDVTLNIYDKNQTLLFTYEQAKLTHGTTGVFTYDFVTSTTQQEYVYEFIGMAGEKPITQRKSFRTAWRDL